MFKHKAATKKSKVIKKRPSSTTIPIPLHYTAISNLNSVLKEFSPLYLHSSAMLAIYKFITWSLFLGTEMKKTLDLQRRKPGLCAAVKQVQ